VGSHAELNGTYQKLQSRSSILIIRSKAVIDDFFILKFIFVENNNAGFIRSAWLFELAHSPSNL
jgi:hypothetical protein